MLADILRIVLQLFKRSESTSSSIYLSWSFYFSWQVKKGSPSCSCRQSYFEDLRLDRKNLIYGWKSPISSICFESILLQNFRIHRWLIFLLGYLLRVARNFIFSGDFDTRKAKTVSRDNLCSLKLEGGLGLQILDVLNKAVLLKFDWESFHSNSFWGISFDLDTR